MASSLLKRLDVCDPADLVHAILDVHGKWSFEEKPPGPNSDVWYMNMHPNYRPTMISEVRQRWCQITGEEDQWFPFNDDFVATAWMMYRKESTDAKEDIKVRLGLLI